MTILKTEYRRATTPFAWRYAHIHWLYYHFKPLRCLPTVEKYQVSLIYYAFLPIFGIIGITGTLAFRRYWWPRQNEFDYSIRIGPYFPAVGINLVNTIGARARAR